MNEHRIEKIALLFLAGGTLVALTWMALAAMDVEEMDPNSATLIGGIATGLIAFSKDIIQAIRGYTMGAQLSRVTDQLANSKPKDDGTQKVEVMNDPLETTDVGKTPT